MKTVKKQMVSKVLDLDEKGQVKIYFAKFNTIDGQDEISDAASFNKTIADGYKRVKHLLDHDKTKLLGLPREIVADKFGAMAVSAMNIKKQFVRDVYEDYKHFQEHGRSMEHSFMAGVVRDEIDPVNMVRRNLEYKLYEYSTINFLAAQGDTPMVAIKEHDLLKQKDDLESMLRGKYSDEKFQLIENKIRIIMKAIEGARIVKCPSCGLKFDYNDQPEKTLSNQLQEKLIQYTNWKLDEEAYKKVQEMEPEMQMQMMEIVSVSKGIDMESYYNHVRCPKCYGVVAKSSLVKSEPEETTQKNKSDFIRGVAKYLDIN